MTKTIHLVRHGHHIHSGVLCGRMPGVGIDERGREEVNLSCAVMHAPILRVQASPQRRAVQSAQIIASFFKSEVEIASRMDEIDLGEWTSRSIVELDQDPRWEFWNRQRSRGQPPGGESMAALQSRVVEHLQQLAGDTAEGTVVIVSHAEPIRAALMHYCGIPLDDFLAIEVDTASVSTLRVAAGSLQVTRVNQKVSA